MLAYAPKPAPARRRIGRLGKGAAKCAPIMKLFLDKGAPMHHDGGMTNCAHRNLTPLHDDDPEPSHFTCDDCGELIFDPYDPEMS